MASGEIVPWTDPGGAPCCCDECPTDDLGPDPIYSPGTFDNIGEDDYAALLAGGSLSMDLSFNLSGTDSNFGSLETWIGSFTGEPLAYRPEVQSDAPCYQQATQINSLIYDVTWLALAGSTTQSSTTTVDSINFTYALATIDGQRKLSLANAKGPSGAGGNIRILELNDGLGGSGGLDIPILHLVVSNPNLSPPSGWQIDSSGIGSLQFVLPNSIYVPSKLALLYFYNPIATSGASFSGSINMAITFTPSAP